MDLQETFDVAVVIPTVLRPELRRAVLSVYRQDLEGRIQVLVGIDKALGEPELLARLARDCPPNRALTVLDLGYSTAERNGGLYPAPDGGALRTMLSLAANSRYVAYLDDDNWWAPGHLRALLAAVGTRAYAYSLRVLVDEPSDKPICVDRWHSVGPNAGSFKALGGLCDPSTLMVDKLQCHDLLPLWCFPLSEETAPKPELVGPRTADRYFFMRLAERFEGIGSGEATCYYAIRRTNVLWKAIRVRAERLGIGPEKLGLEDFPER